MKHESLRLEIEEFDLLLKAKTSVREVILWKIWTGNEKYILEVIKQIAEDDTKAVLYFKHENPIIQEFAQIKVMEFPHEKIDTSQIDLNNISESVTIKASQLL